MLPESPVPAPHKHPPHGHPPPLLPLSYPYPVPLLPIHPVAQVFPPPTAAAARPAQAPLDDAQRQEARRRAYHYRPYPMLPLQMPPVSALCEAQARVHMMYHTVGVAALEAMRVGWEGDLASRCLTKVPEVFPREFEEELDVVRDCRGAPDVVGYGAYGVVLKGCRKRDASMCAIKVVELQPLIDRDMMKQLENEVTIQQSLDHHNVVRLHRVIKASIPDRLPSHQPPCGGMGDAAEQSMMMTSSLPTLPLQRPVAKWFLIMEWCDKGPFITFPSSTYCRYGDTRCLPAWLAGWYLGQALDGAAHIHDKGYTHADLKPDNFLLKRDGRQHMRPFPTLKITDFGWSAAVEQIRTDKCGTIEYMAPEILRGTPYTNNPAIDIWSLGIFLYELLRGHTPFAGKTEQEILAMLGDPDWLERLFRHPCVHNGQVLPAVPPLIETVKDTLRKMLAVDPAHRHTARQLLETDPWIRFYYYDVRELGPRSDPAAHYPLGDPFATNGKYPLPAPSPAHTQTTQTDSDGSPPTHYPPDPPVPPVVDVAAARVESSQQRKDSKDGDDKGRGNGAGDGDGNGHRGGQQQQQQQFFDCEEGTREAAGSV
ncbi:unnamed protein product [Vitrella brassicaformis CCMP3155]|uniref:Protein kinase domain-containing protein n=2 Tax=Vitrella brassicaformis TaxID=1169539 RepID=A0A0G4GVT0_VITBC|nr:unnamed protein product [Vitrella brassicaformis CCMP3155]|eukprot:CEM34986.1 unnamed protein product [Vitrella brassicaformis CCMP3155]